MAGTGMLLAGLTGFTLLFVLMMHHSRVLLWQRLIITLNRYPPADCHSRFRLGLLYGRAHTMTEGKGLSVKARHRMTADALDHALLCPVSEQIRHWLSHNDQDLLSGWLAGKQLVSLNESKWNQDDRDFFSLWDDD